MLHWNFPITEGVQFHGIGDSGIDLFKGDPTKSLTREICQNSIDARVDHNRPVKVEFHSFSIPVADFPGCEELLQYHKQALAFCKKQKFKKAIKFFERTIPLLKTGSISILRISDFNTEGLSGADEAAQNYSSRWFRLVRSVGSSDKPDGSIGAYGSGKLSAFGCSSLQTVFYNTFFHNDEIDSDVTAYEGVSKLIGFEDQDGKLRSDVGYFCEGNSMPIMQPISLDLEFQRKEPGTDVYIIGFKKDNSNWQDDIAVALLDGFLYAILKEHLVVQVDDCSITADDVDELVKKYQNNLQDTTLDYYKVLTEGKVTTETLSYLEHEDIELSMVLDANLHRRVGIIRYPGMKIFDKGNVSSTVSFAGMCVIKGKKISTLLGGMENIQHNKWELSRYEDEPEKKQEAEKYRKKLYADIKELFVRLKDESNDEDIDPDIGDCLPDPISENQDEINSLSDEVLEIKKKRIEISKQTSEIIIADIEGEQNDGDGAAGNGGESNKPKPPHPPNPRPYPGPRPGPDPGPLPGPNLGVNPPIDNAPGDMKKVTHIKAKIKERVLDVSDGKYRLTLIPEKKVKNGYLQIAMAAESESYKAEILSAVMDEQPLSIEGNTICGINLKAKQKGIIDIKLDYSDMCSMEVRVYGY